MMALTVNPPADVLERAKLSQRRWLEYRRFAREQASLPAVTQDGQRVDVTANAGSIADAAEALTMGADGIGLLRTEFLFLGRNTAPTEDEQYHVYRTIAETMKTLPVIVRTLDIGGR
jgi:phosphocarrier protein FPr